MSDNNPKNWDDERLIKLLDSALSSHAYMKEELDKTEWKLAEIVEKLLDKYHDQYEDWRTMFRNRYKHGVKKYAKNVASLIYKLGIKEGIGELCENTKQIPGVVRMKRSEKALLKFEKMFKKGNNKSIQQINGKYLIAFLKSDEYKLYKKREKNYIEVLERIKEFYKEYKSRLQSPKESGIFNNKDPENPNRFRQYHEGQVITDFMEGYLKNNEQYLKSEGAQTPLVVLKKDNHKNDKIMEKHDRIKDMNVDSAKPIIPPAAATTMPPGAEEYIQGVDEYDLSEMQDEEFRPQTPDYDPETPPPAWGEDSIEPRYDSDYYDDYYNRPYEGGFKDGKKRKKKGGFFNWFFQRDSDTNNMNLVVSNKPKRKSIYGEPHPLRKFIVDPRDNDDFDEDRTDGFSISFSPFSGGVKVGKSPRKKTAIEIHRERFNDPEFKKRLFATSDTRVQIFEKEAKKRHDLIIKKMWNKFTDGYKARFGTPNEDDNKVMRLLKINFTGQSSTIRPEDIKYVKDYRAQNAENRAKGHYIYKEFKNMFDMKKKMSAEFRRKREDFRKWDEQDSDGETTGEIALLEKEADKYHGGLEFLPASEGYPHGRFRKTSPYEGNLGKTSPVAFVDIDKPGEEMDDDEFNKYSLKRGGRRTRRRRKKLKRKTKRRKKRKRKTKRKRKKRKTKKIWKSL